MRIAESDDLDVLDLDKQDGLSPVIVQHALSGEVLMLGYADRPALERTLEDGKVTFYSRSRKRQWQKGETSGHSLRLVSLHADCDADAVLARAEPAGPTCHKGTRSCFGAPPVLRELADVIDERVRASPSTGYTGQLLDDANLRLKKLAEEALELALACQAAGPDGAGSEARVAAEAADLVYHLLVACRAAGVDADRVLAELRERRS